MIYRIGGTNMSRYDFTEETCPECCGTGKENATLDWKCYTCNVTGRVKVVNRDSDLEEVGHE